MTSTLRPAAERGRADFGWLDSRHTFGFGEYHDPAHMGFRALRVINEDRVAPGRGFGTHPHHDMEIFTYVLSGALEHKDSMGHGRVLKPGEIQLMSAGRGVTHSEFNPSRGEPLHLLQVWIVPDQRGLVPSYTEWHPDERRARDAKVLVISPDGREASARIHQQAFVYRLRLAPGAIVEHELAPGRGAWIQVARGSLQFDGLTLGPGDGISCESAGALSMRALADAEALLFDLA
ncbi:MAG: pirin family protein [Planctomycetes bacterium]|nr:pirin family protein [Planctomycetota bacterium]